MYAIRHGTWNRFDDNALVVRCASDGKTCGFVPMKYPGGKGGWTAMKNYM